MIYGKVRVVLLLLLPAASLALKNIGDSCSLRNGDVGICRSLTNCPVAALLSVAGTMPETCGIQIDNIVVCCGQSLHTQLFRDTDITQQNVKRVEDNQTYNPNEAVNHYQLPNENGKVFRPPREQSPEEVPKQLVNHGDVAEYYGGTTQRHTYLSSTRRNDKHSFQRQQENQTPKIQPVLSSDNIAFPAEPDYNLHRQIYSPPERLPINSKPSRSSTHKPQINHHETYDHSYQSRPFVTATQSSKSNPYEPVRPPPHTVKTHQPAASHQYKPTESLYVSRPGVYATTSRSTVNKPYRVTPVSAIEEYPFEDSAHNSVSKPYGTNPSQSSSQNRPNHIHQPSNPQVKPVWKPNRPQHDVNQPPPARKRISEQKCDEYSQDVRDQVAALPLLPNPDPVPVHVEKCEQNYVKLIVGGEKTKVGEFPHMAAVGFREGSNIAWNCGGTLISEYYVLTAAHCTYTSLGKPVVVRLGELNLKRTDDEAQPVDYTVAEVIRHPEYRPPAKYNDIGLLKLSRRVEFNKNIRPACLYTRNSFSVNKTTATGWGKVDFAEDPSDVLLKVLLSIIDNSLCNELYHSDLQSRMLPRGIVQSMMCAGELEGGKDTCQGDSGGPLQITERTNRCIQYVIGITSFGKFCAGKNAPGVYTRVSHYVPWIESIVWRSE